MQLTDLTWRKVAFHFGVASILTMQSRRCVNGGRIAVVERMSGAEVPGLKG